MSVTLREALRKMLSWCPDCQGRGMIQKEKMRVGPPGYYYDERGWMKRLPESSELIKCPTCADVRDRLRANDIGALAEGAVS